MKRHQAESSYLFRLEPSLLIGICLMMISASPAFASSHDRCQATLIQDARTVSDPARIDDRRIPIFSSHLSDAGILEFSMIADFAKAKRLSGGGNWTGEDRPLDKFGVPFSITGVGLQKDSPTTLTGMLRIRGMSSADAAKFPKLKIKLDKEQDTQNTLFAGLKGLRINTSGFYNLPEAPYREALAYEIAEILGLKTPRIQRAAINYQQLSGNGKIRPLKEKQALFIENDKDIFNRLKVKDSSEDFLAGKIELDLEQTALLFAFNTLIMNDDINIRVRSEPAWGTEKFRPLFNTSILMTETSNKGIPLVYDLDKSELVSMSRYKEVRKSRFFNRDLNGLELAMIQHLMVLKQRFSEAELGKAINLIRSKMPEIKALVAEREAKQLLDQRGATKMRELIGYFESASEILPSIDINLKPANIFREPEETLEKGLFYSDLFPMETPMRAGTPIKVLEKTSDGKFFKVLILDAREEIQNPESLQANEQFHDLMGYLRVDTPIGKFLDEKDLGQTNDFDMVEFY